ncbi:efflux RND transporter permease subunit [Bacillus sp. SL00103]
MAGGYLFTRLPKRELPEFQANIVTISTVFPGADAKQVESDVTNKLESAISDINGVEKTSSVSAIGFRILCLKLMIKPTFKRWQVKLRTKPQVP